MPAEIIDISITIEQLKEAELAVRQAVAEYGAQHEQVLHTLENYIELLQNSGNTAQAEKLLQRANLLRANLGLAAAGALAANANSLLSGSETHLFNSFGYHVATVYEGNIYTPEGKNLGRFEEELGVFLSLNGRYMGQIVEENRLALDTNWQFRHISFGLLGDSGSRAGWGRQADIGRCVLPKDFEDVKLELE